jgi:cysteine desulfurase
MIYFDHAATTPLDENVLEAMKPYQTKVFGNPSSPHAFGRDARNAVENAREIIADTLNADHKEIVFTSGGTESVNLALKGAVLARRHKGNHIVLSAVEHHCVLDCADWLTKNGFETTLVSVNSEGWANPREVEKAVRKETLLVSLMAANNETGTIEPFREVGRICREMGVLFHTDAVQAYGKITIDAKRDRIDLLSASAHKIYGPKGTGFLYHRLGVELAPQVHGGGQEKNFRGGTENVAGIVGLGAAAGKICADAVERSRLMVMTRMFLDELRRQFPDVRINGAKKEEERLPGILNITLPGIEAEALVHSLDANGFAVSAGSACAAGSSPASHVLLAMGRSPKEAREGLRLSFGRNNTGEQVRKLIETMPSIARGLRMISPLFEDNEKKPRFE